MKKVNWGINGVKLNAYLKMIRKENRTAVLHTVRGENDEDHVWLLTDFLALRVPAGYVYKEIMQPYTMTDAPEFWETKSLTGRDRDAESLVRAVENFLGNADKLAYDTHFTAAYGEQGKTKTVKVFALEDGASVAVNADYAAVFDMGQYASIHGSSYYGPITFEGSYGIKGIVLPVRIESELRSRMDALCACFALPGARMEGNAA